MMSPLLLLQLVLLGALSRDHAASSVTAVLPPPGQRCRIGCLNSHHIRSVQMIAKNVYVWFAGPRHTVSEC